MIRITPVAGLSTADAVERQMKVREALGLR
ncbi:MAG: hypothetical protein ACI8Y6_002063 [Brevundimonas sp.]|jgi:hypothetical protein